VTSTARRISAIIDTQRVLEGGGFPVRRPFPTARLDHVDPFLLLDHLGPVEWPPGGAIGAPAHPHRGFETVTYLLEGRMEHRDSGGHHGVLGPGDVQWMTAGSGVIHSELPEREFQRRGGVTHGFQLWVNLPARDKFIAPRYQEIPRAEIPRARSSDGKVEVIVIAGEALGVAAKIATRTPILYQHWIVAPGGHVETRVPAGYEALAYVFEANVEVAGERVREGQLARLGREGETLTLALPESATTSGQLLLLAGVPLDEPVVRQGPFVLNTREQLAEAFQDYRAGRLVRA
jgi:hypothetical protein